MGKPSRDTLYIQYAYCIIRGRVMIRAMTVCGI